MIQIQVSIKEIISTRRKCIRNGEDFVSCVDASHGVEEKGGV
jgi:hypothetical protein